MDHALKFTMISIQREDILMWYAYVGIADFSSRFHVNTVFFSDVTGNFELCLAGPWR